MGASCRTPHEEEEQRVGAQERKAPSLWFCSLAELPCELGDNQSVDLP